MSERKSDFHDPFVDDPWGCLNGCVVYTIASALVGILLAAWCG